jgi:hypothetical protein
MNELITGQPSLTSQKEVGHGKITSKAGDGHHESENKNEILEERTAHGAVLSLSGRKLAAQRPKLDRTIVVDDISVSKTTEAKSSDANLAEIQASKKDEQSKQGDSESFSDAESSAPITEDSKSKGDVDVAKLVTALQALSKKDCRRILDNPSIDPGHGVANLWNPESTSRLNQAVSELKQIDIGLKAKLKKLDNFEAFKKFVLAKHQDNSDNALAAILLKVSRGFHQGLGGERKIRGFEQTSQGDELRSFYEFLASEDHRVEAAQHRALSSISVAYTKSLLYLDQKSEKLHYRLEAVVKFSRIKKHNPIDKLRAKLIEKLGGDEKIKQKALDFKSSTSQNWSSLAQKIWHSIADFSNILLTNFLSLAADVNEKLGNSLNDKELPNFVRPNAKA